MPSRKSIQRLILFLLSPLLYWFSLLLALCFLRIATGYWRSPLALASLLVFAASVLFFRRFHLTPIYVFGHELTHYIVAKLFLRKTGRFSVSKNRGFVEIENANVWITLAPYIVPIYSLASVGIFGIVLVLRPVPPVWLGILLSVLIISTYAYHCYMTFVALRLQQTDLELFGKTFSISLISFGNLLFVLLALLVATKQWAFAFDYIQKILSEHLEFIKHIW